MVVADVQDIHTQDGFNVDSFALTNVGIVSINAKKTTNISRDSTECKMFIQTI